MAEKLPDEQKPLPNRTQYVADMDNFMPPIRPKPVMKLLAQGLLVIVVVAVIVIGAIWLTSHHKSSAPGQSKTTQANTQQPVPDIDTATKHYDSNNYNLGLNYPADWTVNDTTNQLTVTSPALQLKGQGGQAFTGQLVLTIQNQQTSVPAFAKGTAVAALESQKLTYKNPAQDQRAQTYLTFVSYSGDTSVMNGLYITGDDGYQMAQSIPMSDVVQDNPLVSVNFLKCSDAACSTAGTPTTVPATDWQSSSLSGPLVKLLESLVLN